MQIIVNGHTSQLAETVKYTGRKWSEVSHSNLAVIGHRGATLAFPENTMIGYEYAANVSDGIVCYARTTKDGVMVSIHDDTLDRTTDINGVVANTRYDIINMANASDTMPLLPFQHVPNIVDIFDTYGGKTLVFMAVYDYAAACSVAKLISDRKLHDYVAVWSYDVSWESSIKAIDNNIKLLHTIPGALPTVSSLVSGGYWAVGVYVANGTNQFVTDCHNAGLKVYGYVANTITDGLILSNMGLDFIESDDPLYIINGLKTPTISLAIPYVLEMPKKYIGSGFRIVDANDTYTFYADGTVPAVTSDGIGWNSGNTGNVCIGLGIKTPNASYKINFSVKIKVVNADIGHFGLVFCSDKDGIIPAFATNIDRNQNCYCFQYTSGGLLYPEVLYSDKAHTFMTATFAAYTNESVIPMEVIVTPTTITIKRTDNGNTTTLTDSEFNRSGFIGFYSSAKGVVLRDLTVTAQ
jgi:glycerophosphoryl diester phosphodiesterase